tara:strand:+ start:66 stop:233 length:168 start_codon:yes stop_codon:yes gene_type:complete
MGEDVASVMKNISPEKIIIVRRVVKNGCVSIAEIRKEVKNLRCVRSVIFLREIIV